MMVKKKSLLVAALLALFNAAFSQNEDHVLVKTGQDAGKVIPFQDQYVYKDFREGQLYYPNSDRSETMKLNYNLLAENVVFINSNGDTLMMNRGENIFKYVRIGGDLYHHDLIEGYFLLVTREPKVQLAVKRSWKVLRGEPLVNNGYSTTSSSVGTYTGIRSSDTNRFIVHEDLVYHKAEDYFLITYDGRLFKANKAGFTKLFQDARSEIREYLRANAIDFEKQDDLKKLLDYCIKLSKA